MNLHNGAQHYQVFGQARTVVLEGTFEGETVSAPMEIWLQALVEVMDPSQKTQFFQALKRVQAHGYYRDIEKARVVAAIPMPNLKG